MSLIDNFQESENAKMNWLEKLSDNRPELVRTAELAGSPVLSPKKSEQILHPSRVQQALLVVVAVMAAIFSVGTRGVERHLVLLRKDGSAVKMDLRLIGRDRRVATVIEQYKRERV